MAGQRRNTMKDCNVLQQIDKNFSNLSKSHKKIAQYISEHYDKAAFMTASKLGSIVGISESTVVRFAYELGYDGYPQFQNALQGLIKNKLTTVQRMEITSSKLEEKNILRSVIQSDIEKLRDTLETIENDIFAATVEAIGKAENIYILGARTCSSVASFLGFYLNMISDNVRTIATNSASETFEQIYRVCDKDVVIAISYPRYSVRTLNAVKYAANKGSTIVAITDSNESPITAYATHSLIAECDMTNFVDSLVAPLSLCNALIAALVVQHKETIAKTFSDLEQIWVDYEVYEQKNIE